MKTFYERSEYRNININTFYHHNLIRRLGLIYKSTKTTFDDISSIHYSINFNLSRHISKPFKKWSAYADDFEYLSDEYDPYTDCDEDDDYEDFL